jgi:hypothetical protein
MRYWTPHHSLAKFMIAMKRKNLESYTAILLLAGLLCACSAPGENAGSSNSNASPSQANSNAAPQSQVAQGNVPPAPTPAPLAVQKIPPPSDKTLGNSNSASTPAASNGRLPKLVLPTTKVDFGKQPQSKSLVRAIVIKNGGHADLNIESVVPS